MKGGERERALEAHYMHVGKPQADRTYVVEVRRQREGSRSMEKIVERKLWRGNIRQQEQYVV